MGGVFEGVSQWSDGNYPGATNLEDAVVASATLDVNFVDPGESFTVHRMLRDWSETATYTSLVNGVVADDIEAATEVVAMTADCVEGWISIDISSAVNAWLADPSSNQGLLFQPVAGNTFSSAFQTWPLPNVSGGSGPGIESAGTMQYGYPYEDNCRYCRRSPPPCETGG